MKRILMGLSLASVLLLAEAPLATAAGPWRAQIVDAETKQPLDGVIVLAVWWKRIRGLGGASQDYYDSEEVLTDQEGRFTIAPRTFFSLNPLAFFTGPEFVFFKPGYGREVWPGWYREAKQWPEEKRKRLGRYFELLQLDGIVFELPRLRSLEERKKYQDRILVGFATVPPEKTPLLEKAITEERRTIDYGR